MFAWGVRKIGQVVSRKAGSTSKGLLCDVFFVLADECEDSNSIDQFLWGV